MSTGKRKFFDSKYVHLEKRKANILICIMLWSILMTWLIYTYVIGSVIIQGSSMQPNLLPNERKLFHKWVYHLRDPRPGDIVVADDPWGGLPLIKRVIALPGSQIHFESGKVWVDGQLLEEPYLSHNAYTDGYALDNKTFEIEDEHFFLMGDNRGHSEDSRHLGGISRAALRGVIFTKH